MALPPNPAAPALGAAAPPAAPGARPNDRADVRANDEPRVPTGKTPGRAPRPAPSGAAPGAPIGSMFNERFLFDDEMEAADDSTFMRRYNLSGDDDEFPVLLRHDEFPSSVRI